MYYFYILYSQSLDRYYVGSCGTSVEDRLREHLYNHRGYTGRAKDWRIAYSESYVDRSSAYAREREVKRWKSRKKIESLLSSNS